MVHVQLHARSEQLQNLRERLREHVHRTPETHHTPNRGLHQGQQPLDRVADLQDLEEGELCVEEIKPYSKTYSDEETFYSHFVPRFI